MGQYYKAIILGSAGSKEFVRLWFSPFSFGNGCKLMEHSYINNRYVSAVENLLSPDGMFYMSRLVWAGDYADKEADLDVNLYSLALEDEDSPPSDLGRWSASKSQTVVSRSTECFRYIVNHSKKLFVDKEKLTSNIHPLPLLTSEGNGRGGGDYGGSSELVGSWARDLISVERLAPCAVEYKELVCDFGER